MVKDPSSLDEKNEDQDMIDMFKDFKEELKVMD
jgi:hypothetical protein